MPNQDKLSAKQKIAVISGILFIIAVIVILLMGFIIDQRNRIEQECQQSCQSFDLEFHSSESHHSANDRCWCLDNENNLPVEMPLKTPTTPLP